MQKRQQQILVPETLVYNPNEASDAYINYAKRSAQFPGITWGVPAIDKHIIPMRPGDLVGIMARPGHGKSSLAAYLARKTARDIVARGANDECVVYVTLEQIVEEIEAFFQVSDAYNLNDFAFGRVDIDTIIRGAIKRIGQPIFLMGKSMIRRRKAPRMTIENILAGVRSIEDKKQFGKKPTLVIIDYVQIVPIEGGYYKRWEQVEEATILCKEFATDLCCPVVICVQAGRGVDDREVKLPSLADAQHSSGIEQNVDKLFGLWRPSLTEPQEKDSVQIGGRKVDITPRLIVVKCNKQRMAPAGQVWPLYFAPEYIRLTEMEKDFTAQEVDSYG